MSWQAVLRLRVRLACLLPSHVIHPSLGTLQARVDSSFGPLGSKVEPGQRVAYSADLVTNTRARLVAHLAMEVPVAKELHEVVGHGAPVTRVHKESVDILLDLQRNASSASGDDRAACVERLGDLDLEAFAVGELQDDVRVGDDGVEELVVRVETHNAAVFHQIGVLFKQAHGLVVDTACIRIVD